MPLSCLALAVRCYLKLLVGNGAVTAEMAIRLSQLFSATPELWLTHQANYNLWKAEQELDIHIDPVGS